MFAYHVRLAWLSFKKTPVLSLLVVGAIGLGIGVFVSILTVYSLMIEDPVPAYSNTLFTYKLNNQPELVDGRPSRDAIALVGYRDALNIAKSGIPSRQSLHYQTAAVIYPAEDGQFPFNGEIRLANSGFFSVHRVPFLYGGAWTENEEINDPYQAVLTHELNEQLFSGGDSVGQTIKIGANNYRIVGVMDDFMPTPLYLETDGDAFSEIEGALVPFSLTRELGMRKVGGSIRCSEDPAGDTWLSFLETDCYWIHHWVELEDEDSIREFRDFLDNYAEEQRPFGRFLGPYNNELHNVMSWLDDRGVVNKDYEILLGIAFLFLLVCLLNCIGLLLAKFLGKAGETSLRRALGGSRRMIFKQHLVEISLIGFLGGCAGLLVSLTGLMCIRSLYRSYEQLTHLNLELMLMAILLAIGSTLLAGLLPAWRACRLPVSQYLKSE
jgi:putative ABC transport system permease protein